MIDLTQAPFNAVSGQDCTQAFEDAFDHIQGLGSSRFGADTVYLPGGEYKIGPIASDIQGLRLTGPGALSTRITAKDAQQPYLFHFTSESAAINIDHVELMGWKTTAELDNFPEWGVIFEGGTNTMDKFRVNKCRNLVWLKRGNYNKLHRGQLGFFDGHGVRCGHVDSPGGAALSETRLSELAVYSSATNISNGASENLGTQFYLSSGCGAIVILVCEGGSTEYGVHVVDGLGLGEGRAPGFVSLDQYNAGKNSIAGMKVDNNGNNLRVTNSRFSAQDSENAIGVWLNSDTGAGFFDNLDCHWVAKDAVRISAGIAYHFQSPKIYEIGSGNVSGRGFVLAGGSAKVSISGPVIDNKFQGPNDRDMSFAFDVGTSFTGSLDIYETAPIRNVGQKIRKASGSPAIVRHHTMNSAVI